MWKKPATTLEQLCFKLKHLVSPGGGGGGGGGAVLFRPDTKSVGRLLSGRGRGGGGGGVPYMKGGGTATPNPPPPPPPPPPVSAPAPLPQGILHSMLEFGIDLNHTVYFIYADWKGKVCLTSSSLVISWESELL